VAQYGTWFAQFDPNPGECADLHEPLSERLCAVGRHLWHMTGQGLMTCIECGDQRRLPRQRGTGLGNRSKPGER